MREESICGIFLVNEKMQLLFDEYLCPKLCSHESKSKPLP